MTGCPFTIDFDTSTITLAGRVLPAVAVICPPHPDQSDTDADRTLADLRADSVEVWVPSENGLITEVAWNPDRADVGLHLSSPRCDVNTDSADGSRMWLPRTMQIEPDGTVRPWRLRVRGGWSWEGCDPEWAVEHLLRISRRPVDDLDMGPSVRLVSLADARTPVPS